MTSINTSYHYATKAADSKSTRTHIGPSILELIEEKKRLGDAWKPSSFDPEETQKQYEESAKNKNITEILPWSDIDIEFDSFDDLFEKMAEKYDMEKLKEGELSEILYTLKKAGILDS